MKKDEDGKAIRVHQNTELYKFMLFGDQLVGKQISPAADGFGVKVTKFAGKKIADLPPAPELSSLKFDEPVTLFDGKDLSAWELMGENNVNG